MRDVSRLLYSLKRRYGQSIDYYQETDNTPDILTGKIIKTRNKYTIKRGIFLTQKKDTSSTFLPKASPIITTTSGLIEIGNATLLIDGNDLPKNMTPDLSDYVISSGKKFSIGVIRYIDEAQCYYFILQEFKGSGSYEIHSVDIHDKLTLVHTIKTS